MPLALLLGAHGLAALLCAALASRFGSRVFLLAALAPAAACGWLLAHSAEVLAGREIRQDLPWAQALDLSVPLRLDGLALLLGLLVTGVGAAVLLYSYRYFADREGGLGLVAGVLVLFAGAMLALVLADHLLALYVAWELTTLCSFLLIGEDGHKPEARRAAVRALLVTTGTGFVMLLGLLLLGAQAGTYRVSALVEQPPHGGLTTAALVLVLTGALGKSAQVPFHPWLPAAMVAATPVSAYLHAAAMVKAGTYLVARLSPAFAEVPWTPIVVSAGLATMLLGGGRALVQTDLKRLLAFGTVAQLGFLMVLLGAGTRTAALAGATMLVAHALFKSTLFLVVGVIDREAGTTDLRELTGVRHRAPGLALVAVLACLSMAGLPPTVGYLGKEAALEAFVEPAPGGTLVLAGLVVGFVLTVAYTLYFLWGAFADRPGVTERLERVPATSLAPTAALALGGLVLALAPGVVDHLAVGHAAAYESHGAPYHLKLWHGLTPALLLSLLTLAGGTALFLARGHVSAVRTYSRWVPDALATQDRSAEAVLRGARLLTARTQVGSLPTYLVVILSAVAVVPGAAMLAGVGVPTDVRLWDRPGQAVLAGALAAAVGGVIAARRRLVAVLLVSGAGYFVAGLFVVHGAPDLALAQVLVETLTLLMFVLVVRRMPADAAPPPVPLRALRSVVALLVGGFATLATLAASARHRPSAAEAGYFREAPHAGGPNVVNVVITEFRALDTLGEVTVLAVAATGVASLVLVSSRMGRAPRPRDRYTDEEHAEASR